MHTININLAELEILSNNLKLNFNKIQNSLDLLEKSIANLLSNWVSQSSLSYEESQKKWTNATQNMALILQKLSETTYLIAQNYRISDSANAKRFE